MAHPPVSPPLSRPLRSINVVSDPAPMSRLRPVNLPPTVYARLKMIVATVLPMLTTVFSRLLVLCVETLVQ